MAGAVSSHIFFSYAEEEAKYPYVISLANRDRKELNKWTED